jgi:hypothetical protein
VYFTTHLQVSALRGVLGDIGHQATTELVEDARIFDATAVGFKAPDAGDQVGVDPVFALEDAKRVEIDTLDVVAVVGVVEIVTAGVAAELEVPVLRGDIAERDPEPDAVIDPAAIVEPDALDRRRDVKCCRCPSRRSRLVRARGSQQSPG